ncbi:hypothetical protein CBR_g87612 [Chara braunii]|uniref:Uncharacterized protein n=1 Tax=Chara braunii TaxID=69332 RepID=A0A388JJG1_CHABU|nr:hypothetical protein CBR_g87612 [Chara braunii]|eukprot:GBG41074.1 hypothetical protein CBR_g87612 [Chara braunii]
MMGRVGDRTRGVLLYICGEKTTKVKSLLDRWNTWRSVIRLRIWLWFWKRRALVVRMFSPWLIDDVDDDDMEDQSDESGSDFGRWGLVRE